jgi:hypothetical protein
MVSQTQLSSTTTHGLVVRLAKHNLTLDTVSQAQQNFNYPWVVAETLA